MLCQAPDRALEEAVDSLRVAESRLEYELTSVRSQLNAALQILAARKGLPITVRLSYLLPIFFYFVLGTILIFDSVNCAITHIISVIIQSPPCHMIGPCMCGKPTKAETVQILTSYLNFFMVDAYVRVLGFSVKWAQAPAICCFRDNKKCVSGRYMYGGGH